MKKPYPLDADADETSKFESFEEKIEVLEKTQKPYMNMGP